MSRVPPCSCPQYNPACTRAGAPMTHAQWEACAGHSCTPTQSHVQRAVWDGVPASGLSAPERSLPCAHLGQPTGEKVNCPSCGSHVRLKVFACALLGRCTPTRFAPGLPCCQDCPHFTLAPLAQPECRAAQP